MINRKAAHPGLLKLLQGPDPFRVTLVWDGPARERRLTQVGVNLGGYTVDVSDDWSALRVLLLTESVPAWMVDHFEALLESRGVITP
jgi:hypothetical protein